MDKKYKIVKIHKRDGYYGQRKEIAGKIGIFAEHDMSDIDISERFCKRNFLSRR